MSQGIMRFLGAIAMVAATGLPSSAAMLLTEVIPNVTTTATRGDVVELFNSGPGDVDLTGWVLTDLDDDPIAGVPQDATFAPPELSLPILGAGQFAVIEFVDAAGTAAFEVTNFGLRITAPLLAGSFLGSERDELLLVDDTGTAIDFVAWSDSATMVAADSWEDLSAMTGAVFDYGLTPGAAAWSGPETVTSDAEYYAASVDFTAFSAVSTWGGGALRRRSVAGVFDVGAPDGTAQWEVVPRFRARLGDASDDVPTMAGLRPVRYTGNLEEWLAQLRSTTFPDRRIAPLADQSPPDFVAADLARRDAWGDVLALTVDGQWEAAFVAASAIGYEVVEFLDTASGQTFHILRERFVPGEPWFTGMGTFVFFDGTGARSNVVLEVPHPVHDSLTLEQGALAVVQVRPRLLMIAGTHRNNDPTATTCDGTFDGGQPYRVSDVAHHPDNFFHAAHVWFDAEFPDLLAIQLHGFCCPGIAPHAGLDDDVVVSNGVELPPQPASFVQTLRDRIDAQGFVADGVDLTTAAVFGDDAAELGATNNLQGRISNGVPAGTECNTEAVSAAGGFAHVEQDPDVREEPQHIVDALVEALDLEEGNPSPCSAIPQAGCRTAGAGRSSLVLRNDADDARDRFSWKWGKGAATVLADFADPVSGSVSYHVCVYDGSGQSQPRMDLAVGPGGTCAGKPCWKALSTKGFAFRDRSGSGITALKLLAGVDGKARLGGKGAGAGLTMPALPAVLPVTVQLRKAAGEGQECWESAFTLAPKKNTDRDFRGKQ